MEEENPADKEAYKNRVISHGLHLGVREYGLE
jgi:hypothetical protein